jgi:hypothetical protein
MEKARLGYVSNQPAGQGKMAKGSGFLAELFNCTRVRISTARVVLLLSSSDSPRGITLEITADLQEEFVRQLEDCEFRVVVEG